MELKKFLLIIGSYRGLNFVNIRRILAFLIHILCNFDLIFVNFAKIWSNC